MKKQLSKSGLTDLSTEFTAATTEQFLLEMDRALKTVDLKEVIKVLNRFNIENHPNTTDFLEAFTEMLKIWQKPNQGSMVVGETRTRGSKCIACEIGKNMTVYEFQYQHKEAKEPYNRIIYGYDFGILYDLRDRILFDLRICNAFLSKAEMHKL